MILQYVNDGEDNVERFCNYVTNRLTKNYVMKWKSLLWFEGRYGKITASKLYEAVQCHKSSGNLVHKIIGASKKFDNPHMARGKFLEDKVITVEEKHLSKPIQKCSLILMSVHPMLGASPDGIGDDFVVEVKCPSTE